MSSYNYQIKGIVPFNGLFITSRRDKKKKKKKKKKEKKKKFIIIVIGEWRSRASSSPLTIITNFICNKKNRSYMTLEQINKYGRQCDDVY